MQSTCEIHGQQSYEFFNRMNIVEPNKLGLLSPEQISLVGGPVNMCLNCKRALSRFTALKEHSGVKYIAYDDKLNLNEDRVIKSFLRLKDAFPEDIKNLFTFEDWDPENPHVVVEFDYFPVSSCIVNMLKHKRPLSFTWQSDNRNEIVAVKKLRLLLTFAFLHEATNVAISFLVGDRVFPSTLMTSVPVNFRQEFPTHLGRI